MSDEKAGAGEDGLGEMEKKEGIVDNPSIGNTPSKKKKKNLILETPKTIEKNRAANYENATHEPYGGTPGSHRPLALP